MGVFVHQSITLNKTPTCRPCEGLKIKRFFKAPPGSNLDPAFYKRPYSNSNKPNPNLPTNRAQGGSNTQLAKMQKEVAELKSLLKGNPAAPPPEDCQGGTTMEIEDAIKALKKLGASSTELENKLAARKALEAKPPSLAQISQKLKAADNHAAQCLKNVQTHRELLDASEVKACKAEAEAIELRAQYIRLSDEERTLVATQEVSSVPKDLNMAQQEQYKNAVQTFRTQQAEIAKRCEEELRQTLGNLANQFRAANDEAKASAAEQAPMEEDGAGNDAGHPPTGVASPPPPQPDLGAPTTPPATTTTPTTTTPATENEMDKENGPPPGNAGEGAPTTDARAAMRSKVDALPRATSDRPGPY